MTPGQRCTQILMKAQRATSSWAQTARKATRLYWDRAATRAYVYECVSGRALIESLGEGTYKEDLDEDMDAGFNLDAHERRLDIDSGDDLSASLDVSDNGDDGGGRVNFAVYQVLRIESQGTMKLQFWAKYLPKTPSSVTIFA